MRVLVYRPEDLKADGTLRKKNNSREMTEQEFKDYIKANNLSVSYGYIDTTGQISNGERFKRYLITDLGAHILVGVSGIVKELSEVGV